MVEIVHAFILSGSNRFQLSRFFRETVINRML